MFKNHPKGLLAASLSNMGERFGFYIMMASIVLFLMAKYDFSEATSNVVYSVLYGLIYALALVGGIIADKTKKYKSTIQSGIILMSVGYLLIAIPTPTPVTNMPMSFGLTAFGLLCIAFGNGLFKGNLQALVGQMYDNNEYSAKRDSGFSLFYMFINVGAIFAPLIATGLRSWLLKSNGFLYNAGLPERCHQFLNNKMSTEQVTEFKTLVAENTVNSQLSTDLAAFSTNYLNVFTTGYHYAYGVAIIAMLISLVIYIINKKRFPDPALKKDVTSTEIKEEVQMSAQEIKQRLYALFAVFAVVFFFWLSFHQNGASLTLFAKDYINMDNFKLPLGFVTLEGVELFQSINPIFIVALTPIILGFFGWMRAKGKEPSTPKKIAIGMGIAALAYIVMIIGSMELPAASEVKEMAGGLPKAIQVSPFLLVLTYLVLSIAELFISPLGISFVSKVAPPKYQGLMQGCWLGTTAMANFLLWIGAALYSTTSLTATWLVFVGACFISMILMFSMIKWLERVAK
ncbi:MAG: peptide MFS transporter [Prevotella sp.]|jgi:POT family proton-dependent oligopeptide transporter|nr:peptide MFS transporter [Prevotella sp.]